jgi:hypothetical protein
MNYCSGKKVNGNYSIDFCSKSGKELFDYTDNGWEEYGINFRNIPSTVPRKLAKRKGGGGTGKIKPYQAVVFGPTYHFRLFFVVAALVFLSAAIAIGAIWSYWYAIAAGILIWVGFFVSSNGSQTNMMSLLWR